MRKTPAVMSVCQFWRVTVSRKYVCGLSLSLCVKITIPVLRVLSQIEAELRASSLAGSDCGLKTPSPLSSLTSHTQSSHRHSAAPWLAAPSQCRPLIGHWPAPGAWTQPPLVSLRHCTLHRWPPWKLLSTSKNVLTRQINYILNLSSFAFVLWCPPREWH